MSKNKLLFVVFMIIGLCQPVHGADPLSRAGSAEKLEKKDNAEALAKKLANPIAALTSPGTTFIKLGQRLSTWADLVGDGIAAELSKLQSDIPPGNLLYCLVHHHGLCSMPFRKISA